ncbi:hypothetical protein [Nocardia sp. NPDC052566]|uniref:primosomal protein N' family DNA-binding protein n=1 Tax=Nocardia sp. NPDC052566 TaxID=3364330 RepID=UPI0037CA05BA
MGDNAIPETTAAGHPIARVLPLLSPAHLDRDFDYLVPPELDEIAQPGVRVRVRFAGRLVDGYLLQRLPHTDHTGKLVKLERVVSAERVLTPEILALATTVATRYAGTRADVLRLAIPPRHARTETGGAPKSPGARKNSAAADADTATDSAVPRPDLIESTDPAAPLPADEPAERDAARLGSDAPVAAAHVEADIDDRPEGTSVDPADPAAAQSIPLAETTSTTPDRSGPGGEPRRHSAADRRQDVVRVPVGSPTPGLDVDGDTDPEPTDSTAGHEISDSSKGRAPRDAGAERLDARVPMADSGSAVIGGEPGEFGVDTAGSGVAQSISSSKPRASTPDRDGGSSAGSVGQGVRSAVGRGAEGQDLVRVSPGVSADIDGDRRAVRGAATVEVSAESADSEAGQVISGVESGAVVPGHDGRLGAGSVAPAVAGDEAESGARDSATRGAEDAGESASLGAVDTGAWGRYIHGAAFVGALGQGRGVRAAWQALPGEEWARRLAELAAVTVAAGRSAILMVPDQRDLDRVLAECVRLVGDSAVGLSAGLGPAARYRRWLAVLRGTARVVVGTRAAVFAPAHNLGLIAIWDDGDDTYAEPRAPYPHAREVAMLRAHETGAAFVAAGFARTAEVQAVVDSGWARDLVADRAVVREASPRISAPGDTDWAMERDPVARAVRIPGVAYAAARAALKEGMAVLVQVPRRGYMPALACAKCRTPARCRHCNGPLALPDGRSQRGGERLRSGPLEVAHSPSCRWCGITESAFRCGACGARALRAVVIGAVRTAEELGRAFPGVPIRGSGGGEVLDTVEPGPQVVVATVGAEPIVRGGYGVALLLDGWALLGRADLRVAEDALRRWLSAAALVRSRGQVIVMAEPSIPTVQALLRWDPVGHAQAEVAARAEVGFPPAVRMAAIDGSSDGIAELLSAANLPDFVTVLGPVPLPDGARKPFTGDSPAEVERILLRVDRTAGLALARALTAAQAVRSTHRSDAPLRVQIDPVDIG